MEKNNQGGFLRLSIACISLLGVVLGAGPANAERVSGATLPESLKDIQPAARGCQREGVAALGAGDIQAAPDFKPDFSCAMSAKSVSSLAQGEGAFLADTRLPGDFAVAHIEGSLNLSLAELRNKPYWRNKTVVLVGNGKAESELYSACTEFKRLGYKRVHVLHGGMLEWTLQGLPVAGTPTAPAQLAHLSATELWHESRNPANLLLLDPAQTQLKKEMAGTVVLEKADAEGVKKALEKRLSGKGKNTFLAAVVLAADPGVTEGEIEAVRQVVAPVPLLVYRDTPEVFSRDLVVQKAVWEVRARGPKQPRCGAG